MIRKWSVGNFKSVGDEVSLDFSPLTVFAGPNNSGKSTIIQSLLLTAQTVQSQVRARSVVLNAQMVRLGDYSDIVHGGELDKDISIGFTIDIPSEYPRPRSRRTRRGRAYRFHPHYRSRPDTTISFNYTICSDASSQSDSIQEALNEVQIEVRQIGDEKDIMARLGAVRDKRTPEERLSPYSIDAATQNQQQLRSLDFDVTNLFPRETQRRRPELVDQDYIGVSFDHFLPQRLSAVYNTVATEVRAVSEALLAPTRFEWRAARGSIESAFKRTPVRRVLMESVEDLMEELSQRFSDSDDHRPLIARRVNQLKEAVSTLRNDFTPDNWQQLARSLPPSVQGSLAEKIEARGKELRSAIRGGRDEKYDLTSVALPDLLSRGSAALGRHLTYAVRYLGPLRDEPKSIYPLSGATDPNDVGLKGEHTAAVLDLNKTTLVEYVPPDRVEESIDSDYSEGATLINAVKEWLRYMGVGSGVATVDQGKLGHELKIRTEATDALHDLTQVGVGVSQVLPILVSSLLAVPGSILIFEQPELHLHPRVQARLADFFVSMIQLGKQCVVETHSEYLINRLRYQVANSEGKDISDEIKIYFAEKVGAESVYRPITINQYGSIDDWPRGFFDEGERMAASILEAGIRKRKNQN